MKKLLRILAWTAGAVALLVVLLVVGLRLFLPADKLRDLAVARASAALGREVTVQEVGVSLRGGVGVRLAGVTVGNPPGFGGEPLLAADGVDLKLRLKPLLRRQIHADRLVVERPAIRLVRLDSLLDNFTFAPPGKAPAAARKQDAGGAAAASLNLERFVVRGGSFSFTDRPAGTGLDLENLALDWSVVDQGGGRLFSSGSARADSLRVAGPRAMALGPIALGHEAEFDPGTRLLKLSAGDLEIAGVSVGVTGSGDFSGEAPVAEAALVAGGLDLGGLLELAPAGTAALEGVEAAGSLDLKAEISFDGSAARPLAVHGSVTLTGGRLVLPASPDPVEDIGGRVEFDLASATFTAVTAKTAGASLSFAGKLTGLDDPDTARLDGDLSWTADLQALQGRLPAERKAELSGRAEGAVSLKGAVSRPAELVAGGRLSIFDLKYRDATIFEPLTDLDAVLAFDAKDLKIEKCAAVFAPSRFSLTGTIRGLVPAVTAALTKGEAPAARPHFTFAVRSEHLNVDHLFPAASPGIAPAAAGSGPQPAVLAEFPDFTGEGTAAVDRLIYGGVDFTGITGKVTIADRKVTVRDAKGAVFAGEVTGGTVVDLKDLAKPGYKGDFAARGIEADSLLTRFSPLHGHVFGKLDFSGDFAAAGKDPATFRRSLSMQALSAMTQGRLRTSGVVQKGMTALAGKVGREFRPEEPLRDLAGSVKVAGERVLLEKISTRVESLGALTIGGGYGFAGDLDFSGELLLTEENSAKLLGGTTGKLDDKLGGKLGGTVGGTLGGLLGGKEQPANQPAKQPTKRLALPVKVRGTWQKPDIVIDFAALTEAAGQNLADELKGKLEGMFKR